MRVLVACEFSGVVRRAINMETLKSTLKAYKGWVLPMSSIMRVMALDEAGAAAEIARLFFPHRKWSVQKQNGNWRLYTRTRKGEVQTDTFIHVEAAL